MASRPFVIASSLDRQRAAEFVAGLSMVDAKGKPKRWEMTVQPVKKRRSIPQNRLYWKWVNEVADAVSEHTGYTSKEVHEIFKQKFLEPKRLEINGETYLEWTTTDLTTAQMSAYCDQIYQFATQELGILLPLPEEMHQR